MRDEELGAIEARLADEARAYADSLEGANPLAGDVRGLVDEVRRLRGRIAGEGPLVGGGDGGWRSCTWCRADEHEPHAADCLWIECGGKP